MQKSKLKYILFSTAGTFTAVFLILMFFANLIILQNKDYIYPPSAIATSTIVLVFGGGLNEDGTTNDMAADRVAVGAALVKSGKAGLMMITGDDGRRFGNEVDAMKKTALDLGVPAERIILDRHGYRTYESCYRQAKVYGIKEVIAVSQSFHLPRIIYLCESFRVRTRGVASDLRDYGYNSWRMSVRETGARLKAWWQVNITRPLPLSVEK